MVLTKHLKAQAMTYMLDTVLGLEPDSEVHKAMTLNQILSPRNLRGLDKSDNEQLEYPTATAGVNDKLSKGMIGLQKCFKEYVAHKAAIGQPIKDPDWVTISQEEYDDYRCAPASTLALPQPMATPRPAQPPPDLVQDFRRGIKRDINLFMTFKDDAAWDNWNRSTIVQARAQDVADILDPTYVPSTTEERDLFTEKQKYIYAVLRKH